MQTKPSEGATRPRPRKKAEPPETPAVGHEDIARLAYFYWEARSRQVGSPVEDWLRAEQELKRIQETLPRKRVLRRKAAS